MTDIALELEKISVSPTKEQLLQLEAFCGLLFQWSERLNLTALPREEYARKHFADSLSVMPLHLIPQGGKVIDIGTGAGFPGLPLAIMHPETRFYLLDSTRKKIDYLEKVIAQLNLTNVECIFSRAEDGAQQRAYREQFDVAVSRAVASMPVLTELAMGYVKKGGKLIAYKGSQGVKEAEEAANCIQRMGGDKPRIYPGGVADLDYHLIVVDKVKPTPPTYPRNYAQIKKKPL